MRERERKQDKKKKKKKKKEDGDGTRILTTVASMQTSRRHTNNALTILAQHLFIYT